MAQFEVSTSKLNDEASQLLNLKRQLEQEITTLESIAARYLNMWEGEAKQAFVESVRRNATLLKNFTNNMEKFAKVLTEGASSYESGEQAAKRIANSKGQ